MKILRDRKIVKMAREVLAASTHLRNMRGDLLKDVDLASLGESEKQLKSALKSRDVCLIEKRANELHGCVSGLTPVRSFPVIREYVEIAIVVAIVVVAFRAYFFQPFKIPTGSMQPTLNGILYEYKESKGVFDHVPLTWVKWIITGKRYKTYRSPATGDMIDYRGASSDKSYVEIGGVMTSVPKGLNLRFKTGDTINKGDVLWSGTVVAGDHVFVNMITYNFRHPRRGEVIVFNTGNIRYIKQGIHYIKRLVGLPGERIAIRRPDLYVNGCKVDDPRQRARDRHKDAQYPDYHAAGRGSADIRPVILFPGDEIRLRDNQYFTLGDNTLSSLDGRYWGSVPQDNLLGPAVFVYWPFSSHWGLIP